MTLSILVDYGADFTCLCPMMPLASPLQPLIGLIAQRLMLSWGITWIASFDARQLRYTAHQRI